MNNFPQNRLAPLTLPSKHIQTAASLFMKCVLPSNTDFFIPFESRQPRMRSYVEYVTDKAAEQTSWIHSRICNCGKLPTEPPSIENTVEAETTTNSCGLAEKQKTAQYRLLKKIREIQSTIPHNGKGSTWEWPVTFCLIDSR